VISIGNCEFLAFSRDYYGTKLKCPQLVIKNFEYILDELGRKQLGPLYPDDSTTYILSRSNNLDVAGIEDLQSSNSNSLIGISALWSLPLSRIPVVSALGQLLLIPVGSS
jgi:hypothetical protein